MRNRARHAGQGLGLAEEGVTPTAYGDGDRYEARYATPSSPGSHCSNAE